MLTALTLAVVAYKYQRQFSFTEEAPASFGVADCTRELAVVATAYQPPACTRINGLWQFPEPKEKIAGGTPGLAVVATKYKPLTCTRIDLS